MLTASGPFLVTGGAGFIGSNFVRKLIEETDVEVIVIDSLSSLGSEKNLKSIRHSQVTFVEGDVCDASLVEKYVKSCKTVVHFAAESHNDNSLRNPRKFVETNVLGTLNILEAARKYDIRLHHISTDEVFGDLDFESPVKFDENTPYNPSSPYSASKASSDHLVRAWVRSFGINATISNCSNNYGPFQSVEKFIPRQITNLLLGKNPILYGTGDNVRDWVHVDDHNSAIFAILNSGLIGETYLIGANCEVSNKDIIRQLLEILELENLAVTFVKDRPGHDLRYAIDASKLATQLGWSPEKRDLKTGLAETVSWYRDNPDYWRDSKKYIEKEYSKLDWGK